MVFLLTPALAAIASIVIARYPSCSRISLAACRMARWDWSLRGRPGVEFGFFSRFVIFILLYMPAKPDDGHQGRCPSHRDDLGPSGHPLGRPSSPLYQGYQRAQSAGNPTDSGIYNSP